MLSLPEKIYMEVQKKSGQAPCRITCPEILKTVVHSLRFQFSSVFMMVQRISSARCRFPRKYRQRCFPGGKVGATLRLLTSFGVISRVFNVWILRPCNLIILFGKYLLNLKYGRNQVINLFILIIRYVSFDLKLLLIE